jgi:hypothetical protein
MVSIKRCSALLLVVVLVAAGISSEARAEAIKFGDDGWYTWRVASTGELAEERFYVRIRSGEPQEIEITGHWCNGWKYNDARHPDATDLGLADTDESIDWFRQFVGDRSDLGADAVAAISMHDSERAVQILIDVVESDADMEVREEAVFWMVQSGSEAAFVYLDRLLMKQ